MPARASGLRGGHALRHGFTHWPLAKRIVGVKSSPKYLLAHHTP